MPFPALEGPKHHLLSYLGDGYSAGPHYGYGVSVAIAFGLGMGLRVMSPPSVYGESE